MYKVMIVDDERLARVEIKRLLKAYEDFEIVAEAKNATEALEVIKNNQLDLIFLDINMPEMNGMELAAEIKPETQFIFCTAFNEHAVDAFSLNAFDYIVKPIDPERLSQTIDKFRANNKKGNDKVSSSNYLADKHGLLLKFGHSSRIVRLQEIERFESTGNYIAVYTADDKSYILSSLTKIEQRLDPNVFFKVSRSEIIRVDCIKEIEEGMATGGLLAIMLSGHEIVISRRQAIALKNLFNIWN